MKKLFIAVMLLTLASCEEPNVKKKPTEYQLRPLSEPLQIVVIDGCQYLYGDWGAVTVLTHKGNCTNFIHKSKSE